MDDCFAFKFYSNICKPHDQLNGDPLQICIVSHTMVHIMWMIPEGTLATENQLNQPTHKNMLVLYSIIPMHDIALDN